MQAQSGRSANFMLQFEIKKNKSVQIKFIPNVMETLKKTNLISNLLSEK